jgi:hypothetical protein
MSSWDSGTLGPPIVQVDVELYTSGYRVEGHMLTRFRRVADILNLSGSTHLIIEQGTVTEYAAPAAPRSAPQLMVAVDTVLFGISSGTDDRPADELRIQKRAVEARIAMPPFWLTGMVHVPQGSRPMDGLLNVADRFLPLTDVTVSSLSVAGFDRSAPILAVQRMLAEVMIVSDDEAPDELLADVMPEDQARGWLAPGERPL